MSGLETPFMQDVLEGAVVLGEIIEVIVLNRWRAYPDWFMVVYPAF